MSIMPCRSAVADFRLSVTFIAALLMAFSQSTYAQSVFVNELHYDNASTDSGEAIEIAGPAGTDLGGWSIVLYNGNGGAVYRTTALSGVLGDQQGGFGTMVVNYPTNGIQNGSPDGIALVNASSAVVQFLSYEGSFTAVGGPANGMISADIGVSEASSTPIGQSLQLGGSGADAGDFSWMPAAANTFGAPNTDQTLGGDPTDPPATPLIVINEIHADPSSGIEGDANGDGVRNATQDEFVEIVNTATTDLDMSGWTLSDGFGVRHVFPVGSIVPGQCAVVVFGGNTPTGTFGNTVVQTASSGALGLNNTGDSVTISNGSATVSASYGSEGGNNQSLTLDPDVTGTLPYVQHTTASGAGGQLFSPGTKVDGMQFDGCEPLPQGPFEIYEIQGDGDTSPFAGQLIETRDNVVTALGTNGFFMQTPTARSDNNVDTSDGIFVFSGGAPSVSVGDLVNVTGQVVEFFGFTEFTGSPDVTVSSNGNTLPAALVFDANVPSPDPGAPSCAIEFECYESMLIRISNGTVSGPNQRFSSDTVAEAHITAAPLRTFREPGIEYPGLMMPPIATWDGNPEVFELDPDKLGLPNRIIPAGSHFDTIGVLGFEFGGYELWPSELTVREAVILQPVRTRERAEFTVASLNLFRLFDDVNDPPDMNSQGGNRNDSVVSTAEYERRRAKFAAYIVNVLDAPDILAVQEAEKLEVLQALTADIATIDAGLVYEATLLEGNDIGTIDVGFLVRDTAAVDNITQIGKDEIFAFDGSLLHDRPPLLIEARSVSDGADFPLSVMVVHNRSLSSIDSPSSGERVRQKRLAQAQSIAAVVQDLQAADPEVRLVIVGDFNAFEFSDGYVDAVGQIAGDFNPADNLLSGPDLVEPDLLKQVLSIGVDERYSFIFRGNAQVLDHALTGMALDGSVRGLEFGRGNADAAVDLINDASSMLRASDHDGLVLYLSKDRDGDGVNDDADVCPATIIPEGAPTRELGVNRWALTDGDFAFDTTAPQGKGPGRAYSTQDTAGCSCSQIIAAQGLGGGHVMHGCSIGAMDNWVSAVGQ